MTPATASPSLVERLREYADVYRATGNKDSTEYELMTAAADAIEALTAATAPEDAELVKRAEKWAMKLEANASNIRENSPGLVNVPKKLDRQAKLLRDLADRPHAGRPAKGGEMSDGTTHAEGCWSWGPKHYECARGEIERLRSRLREAEAAYVEVRLALEKLVSATPGTNFRMHFKRAVETLQSTTLGADVSAVIERARKVHANFVKSEAQGFRSRDRQYAIDLLGPVLAKLGKKT